MNYNGFYINLARNPERRLRIEAELAVNQLIGYERFAGTVGNGSDFPIGVLNAGEMGCFLSHWRLLKDQIASSKPLHVIEDDILLAPQTGQVLSWAIESEHLSKFDILFTDVAVPLLNDACHEYKKYYDASVRRDAAGRIDKVTFSVVDMRELIFASTCSFLVNPRSIEKIVSLYERELHNGPALPVDLYIRKLCQDGDLQVGCVFPFVTSIRPETVFESTMEKRFEDLPALAANMLRHSFFVGCDWDACLRSANANFPQLSHTDTHRQIMHRLLGYTLTAGYKKN